MLQRAGKIAAHSNGMEVKVVQVIAVNALREWVAVCLFLVSDASKERLGDTLKVGNFSINK